jgi:hypothetical protein
MNRKVWSTIAFGLFSFVATEAISLPKANAFVLVDQVGSGLFQASSQKVEVVCWALLPFCLLDEKVGNKSTTTLADLKDNGYSDDDIKVIQADQIKLLVALRAKGKSMTLDKNDTFQSLNYQLGNLVPTISRTYVRYLIDSK